jgi:glutaredoxin
MTRVLHTLLCSLFIAVTMFQQLVIADDETIISSIHQLQNVFVYTKKDSCEDCHNVADLLDKHNVKYKEIDLLWNPKQYMLLKRQTEKDSPPYVFIGNKFIGGHKELKKILQKQKSISVKRPNRTKTDV